MSLTIHLEELEHQKRALKAIRNAFPHIAGGTVGAHEAYANPLLEHGGVEDYFIDCKMETGTGKTYVYTRMMYELHKMYGLFKFIIVVPSLAIREGTEKFIDSSYARQHFSRFYPNIHLNLGRIAKGDFTSRGGRKTFPSSLSQYVEATRNEKTSIQCLLLCDSGFLNNARSSLFKDDFDQTLMGASSSPVEALRLTRPIVIIDEPHRIKRESKTYTNIMEKIKPQMIVRFGATFPEVGAKKSRRIDYFQGSPQFNLGAVESFNEGLVKAVDVNFPQMPAGAPEDVYRVKAVTGNSLTLTKDGRDHTLSANESLAQVDPRFEGNVEFVGGKLLSNELELEKGMSLMPGTFMQSYQELLLRSAIDAHFAKEMENFSRDNSAPKVKTLSLFFIDSIESYRDDNGWLRRKFEQLLREKIEQLLSSSAGEYKEFLLATLNDISASHGGYFAKDQGSGKSDERIAEEVDDILRNKTKLLTFKDDAGRWNTRRFLFSKWTLREGWDNPNIFVICKLRKSGSESSKIQEAGRGLRLPVDELGNRLSREEFRLDYIVGLEEREFARRLTDEINVDAYIALDRERLTDAMVEIIAKRRLMSSDEVIKEIGNNGLIEFSREFKQEVLRDGITKAGFEWFLIDYPELSETQLRNSKVTSPTTRQQAKRTIRLRQENWNQIRDMWKDICQRRMIRFERLDEAELANLFAESLNTEGLFAEQVAVQTIQKMTRDDEGVDFVEETADIAVTAMGKLEYREFVKRLHKQTYVPINVLHESLWNKLTEISKSGTNVDDYLNGRTLEKIVRSFEGKFAEVYAFKYEYDSLDVPAEIKLLQDDGSFVDKLPYGRVGSMLDDNIGDNPKSLYELPPLAFDSELEHRVLRHQVPNDLNVTVFGKIPTRAIAVPTYTGGTTTPDFIYYIEDEESGEARLCLLLETKASNMRMSEGQVIAAQQKFFESVEGVEWKLATELEDVMEALRNL